MNEDVKGCIKISDDVVATIASITARETEGVAGMSTGIAGEIYEFIGKKVPTKGVKVETGEGTVTVDIYIIVNYGVKINEVAGEVQLKVKNAIEEMTNLNSEAVNVHVQGIKIAKEEITDESEITEPPAEIPDDAEAETAKSEE